MAMKSNVGAATVHSKMLASPGALARSPCPKDRDMRRLLALAALTLALAPAPALAHWCDCLWDTNYNIVVRPVSDSVSVPGSMELWVQNNMGYPLVNFALTATATGFTISPSHAPFRVPNYLMPGEKVKYTLNVTGSGNLNVTSLDFAVSFGHGTQSHNYGGNGAVMIRKAADGSLFPTPTTSSPTWLGGAGGQAEHLGYSQVADFGNAATDLNDALDALLQEYCAGGGSWDAGGDGSAVTSAFCASASSSTCPTKTDANATSSW
jgi:hypothetical protein